jgi:hypothetical protein
MQIAEFAPKKAGSSAFRFRLFAFASLLSPLCFDRQLWWIRAGDCKLYPLLTEGTTRIYLGNRAEMV